jgi:hypothetical protein
MRWIKIWKRKQRAEWEIWRCGVDGLSRPPGKLEVLNGGMAMVCGDHGEEKEIALLQRFMEKTKAMLPRSIQISKRKYYGGSNGLLY